MFASNFKYSIVLSILLLIAGCKSTQQITVVEEYFEEYQGKQIVAGHYGGYFILDGSKRVYKLHLSTQEEIIIESDFEEGQIVYSGRDFFRNKVILYSKDKVYRVVRGDLNLYKQKDKVEVTINVLGIKDMWELVADSIPRVEDGNHHNVVFEGRIGPKKEE